ncbi:MAG: tRNA (N(6)-L-threonylcarbamoyladenosine(37)-C(2))-methylthiotransferase MtaB [Nitrospirae bacterium]|nr:tRNA (N(6)-L-threonylcarbamoyladenosine(37)-C(2))-methylthiotransferase MtaB [Nitrospirota bacterium]
MKVAVQTLGCKVNQSESAIISGLLKEGGFEVVDSSESPDILIINTCTVTKKSDYQSRQMIRRAVKSGAKVVATGCYAQLRHDELHNIKGLSLIVGNHAKEDIVNRLNLLYKGNGVSEILIGEPNNIFKPHAYRSDRSRAFMKIQDGCDSSCTYCSVPLARGRNRSLSAEDVIDTAGMLTSQGYEEIVLTGIHIGCYGLDLNPSTSLLNLAERLSIKYPQIRLRLSSIEPQEFESGILDLMKDKNVCPHIHIPLQSGSDKILLNMGRKYNASFFSKLINDIAEKVPGVSIGTDIIAGFPGEEDDDFQASYDLLAELPLSYLHVFPYSNRPGTKASGYPNQVNEQIKKERTRMLRELGMTKKNHYISKQIGKRLDVIIERSMATTEYHEAISDNYLKIKVKGNGLIKGKRYQVTFKKLEGSDIICTQD